MHPSYPLRWAGNCPSSQTTCFILEPPIPLLDAHFYYKGPRKSKASSVRGPAFLGSSRLADSPRPSTHTHTCVTSGLPPYSSITRVTPSSPGWKERAPTPPMHRDGPQVTWVRDKHLTRY